MTAERVITSERESSSSEEGEGESSRSWNWGALIGEVSSECCWEAPLVRPLSPAEVEAATAMG